MNDSLIKTSNLLWSASKFTLSSTLLLSSKGCEISWKLFRKTLKKGWKKDEEEDPYTFILLWRAFQDGVITLELIYEFVKIHIPDLPYQTFKTIAADIISSGITNSIKVIII